MSVYYTRQAVNSKKERKTNQPTNEGFDSGIVLYYMYVCIHATQLYKQMKGVKYQARINMLQRFNVVVFIVCMYIRWLAAPVCWSRAKSVSFFVCTVISLAIINNNNCI